MLCFFLWATLVTAVYPWNLTTTHSNVILQVSDDVTLRCSDNSLESNEYNSTLERITRIRLLKLSSTTSNSWKTYADIRLPDVSYVVLTKPGVTGLVTSGYLGKPAESFLSLSWKTASYDTVGTYKCEVDGFSTDEGQDVHVDSADVILTNNVPTTEDLVDVIMQMRANLQRMSKSLELVAQQQQSDNTIVHQEMADRDGNQTVEIISQVKSMFEENQIAAQYWPSGNYSLLATSDGCPDTPFSSMLKGYTNLVYESRNAPKHNVSSPGRFSQPFFDRCDNRNAIYLKFCTKRTPNELDIAWPKGHYCIFNGRRNSCSANFIKFRDNLLHWAVPEITSREK